MQALLIIDMQNGCFSASHRHNADGVVSRINKVSGRFRSQNKMVVFIQHDGSKEDYLFHGSEDWSILPTLIQGSNDLYVEKTANDSFYKTNLEKLLIDNHIDELYITGCATDFCVNATVHSALVKDFNITIIKDCHTTADRPGFSAVQLIVFHEWLWKNLTPTGGRIRVQSLDAILEERDGQR